MRNCLLFRHVCQNYYVTIKISESQLKDKHSFPGPKSSDVTRNSPNSLNRCVEGNSTIDHYTSFTYINAGSQVTSPDTGKGILTLTVRGISSGYYLVSEDWFQEYLNRFSPVYSSIFMRNIITNIVSLCEKKYFAACSLVSKNEIQTYVLT